MQFPVKKKEKSAVTCISYGSSPYDVLQKPTWKLLRNARHQKMINKAVYCRLYFVMQKSVKAHRSNKKNLVCCVCVTCVFICVYIWKMSSQIFIRRSLSGDIPTWKSISHTPAWFQSPTESLLRSESKVTLLKLIKWQDITLCTNFQTINPLHLLFTVYQYYSLV